MKLLIGIDDTDNLLSRGTGYKARQLGISLTELELIELVSITRHQLLVDSRIPYTSHNSSASLVCENKSNKAQIIDFCREFLIKESAEGSDAGLCIADWAHISENIVEWGNKAKNEILTNQQAQELAEKENIFLEGLTGKKLGVIGSLAAVGLRKGGNDGRLLWLKGLRELKGVFAVDELSEILKIDEIISKDGFTIQNNSKIRINEWCRPVNKNNKVTLIVEEVRDNEQFKWQNASKEFIKSISQ